MEFPKGNMGAEKESKVSSVAVEQLRRKVKSYRTMLLKTGLNKLERKMAEQSHTEQICTLHCCVSLSRLWAQRSCPVSHGAASANNRDCALSRNSQRNRSILNRAGPKYASQLLASSHCTGTRTACPAGRQKGQESCPHPTSTAVMPGELWWEQHWRQGSVQGPGAPAETNWIRLVLDPPAGTQHGVTEAAAHATRLAGRP